MAIRRASAEELKKAQEDKTWAETGGGGNGPAGAGRAKAHEFKAQVTGFHLAEEEAPERVIAVLVSPQKCGKSHFGLTAPAARRGKREGVGIFNLDIGLERVVQKFQRKKKVYVANYRIQIPKAGPSGWTMAEMEKVAEEASRVWDGQFLEDYQRGLERYRSIVIDTATEVWELHRLARFGKLEQVKPHHYGPVNAEHRELIRWAYDCDINLVYIQKMKPEYVDNEATGKLKPGGFSDARYMSQVNLQGGRMRDDKGELKFTVTVVPGDVNWGGCRLNPEAEGITFIEPDCSFADIASIIVEGSKPGDWL